MRSLFIPYAKPSLFGFFASLALLACVGPDHMTEQEMYDTMLTCEEMFGPDHENC